MTESCKMAQLAYDAMDDCKAENIKVLEIGEITTIADYFVIANGSNSNQVNAMVERVEEALAKEGHTPKRIEGSKNSGWILMDYGDVIIHIFAKEDRLFYDLERIWRDGKEMKREDLA